MSKQMPLTYQITEITPRAIISELPYNISLIRHKARKLKLNYVV